MAYSSGLMTIWSWAGTAVQDGYQVFSQRNRKNGGTLTEMRKTRVDWLIEGCLKFRSNIRVEAITGE